MTRYSDSKAFPLLVAAIVVTSLVWSGVAPKDRLTWILEVSWVIAGLPAVFILWRRFPLTPMLLVLLAIHAVILNIGGRYTYAEVPIGRTVSQWFGSDRNHYDRLGHFAQGFVPAILARELLIRNRVLARRGWLFFLVTSICLAFSAFFELIEWAAAAGFGDASTAYLATQGDQWDTQADMLCCLVGAILSQLLLGRWHSRQIAHLVQAHPDLARKYGTE